MPDLDAGPADRVIADYLWRLDRGEAVSRDEMIAAHPELAEDLRAYFDDLDDVEQFAGSTLGLGRSLGPGHRASRVGRPRSTGRLRPDPRAGPGRDGRGLPGAAGGVEPAGLRQGPALGPVGRRGRGQRFIREAEAPPRSAIPNIVSIHELGQVDGRHFFAMEYVEGQTLAELVRDGPLPADRAARYVREIAEAVEHAHRQGILHRDLKPSNVLIDADDRPRITDFGLARRLDATPGGSLTTTGAIVGTPAYMPPEQAAPASASGMVGPRSDVYAMGAVLYELVTGRPPFRGETPLDTLVQVRTIEPVRPGLLNPKVPVDLETIGLRCLEKDPARRYESALRWPTTWPGSSTAGRSGAADQPDPPGLAMVSPPPAPRRDGAGRSSASRWSPRSRPSSRMKPIGARRWP